MTRTIVSVIASLAIGGAVGSAATQHFMIQVTCPTSADPDSAAREAATKRFLGSPALPTTGGQGY